MERIKGILPSIPQFGNFWKKNESAPSEFQEAERTFIRRVDKCIVKYRELCSWKQPKHSLLALVAINLIYLYSITIKSTSALSTVSWIILIIFLYYTWTTRIWPTIRVPPPPQQEKETVEPATKEMEKIWGGFKMFGGGLIELRSSSPTFFFAASAFVLAILAYFGTLLSGVNLVYSLVMGGFIIPVICDSLKMGNGSSETKEADFEEYVPAESKNTSQILESAISDGASVISEMFKEYLDFSNSCISGMNPIPSYDEDDELEKDDEFLPTTQPSINLTDDIDDISFALPSGGNIREIKGIDLEEEDDISDGFEMISDQELGHLDMQ